MSVMTSKEFVERLKNVAENYKTLYVLGCIGAPLTGKNVERYCTNYDYNKQETRTKMIQKAANQEPPVYGFDCVCLVKSILWGWNGTASAAYGGAKYLSNGVPDIGTEGMIDVCSEVSTDFSEIEAGELLWCQGHVGVYIGDGLAVECTPAWKNKVQITACNCTKDGYNRRNWKKHGKLPYIEYEHKAEVNVGDVVTFSGNTHYTSSYKTAMGKACKSGRAEVIGVNKSGAHPYCLAAVDGGNVRGWVNACDIAEITVKERPALNVGDRVKLAAGATVYGGTKKFAFWLYALKLYVRDIQGDRVVVSVLKNGAVTGAVDIKYLTVVD